MTGHSSTSNQSVSRGGDRRRLISLLWVGLGVVAAAELGWIGRTLLRSRPRRELDPRQLGRLTVGGVDDLAPGSVSTFARHGFFLVRGDDGGYLALAGECSHRACPVSWVSAEQRFVCPCHASAFDRDGEVLSPPAPRPLDRFAVAVVDGRVVVDLGLRIQRGPRPECRAGGASATPVAGGR